MSGAFDAGTVTGRLILDLNEWTANIEKAKADTTTLGGVVNKNKDEIEKLGKSMTVVGAAIVGSFGLMIKSAQNFTLEAGRLSDRTGIAIETISGMREAADDVEVSMGELSAGFRRFASSAADASSGNKTAQETFAKLGISVTDSSGKLKSMDALLLESADGFAKMENGTEKAALAQDLFGRGGAALIPLLNKGSEGIKEYTESTKQAGIAITQEGVEKARAFRIALDDLDDAFMGVKLQVQAALVPVVQTLANAMTGVVQTFRKVTDALGPVGDAITITVGAFGGLAAIVGPFLMMLPRLTSGWTSFVLLVPKIVGGIKAISAAMSLSIPIYAAVLAAILAVNAATNIYIDLCDEAMAKMSASADEAARGWKFAQASMRGETDITREKMQQMITRLREAGRTGDEIGEALAIMFRDKISASMKTVAADSKEMADKVLEAQKELTTKMKELTLGEFDFRIYQAQQYYQEIKDGAKGSVNEAAIAAQAERALAIETAKIRREQAAAGAEAEKKSFSDMVKYVQSLVKPVKTVFGELNERGQMAWTSVERTADTAMQKIQAKVQETGKSNIFQIDFSNAKMKKSFSDVANSINQTIQVLQQGFGQFFSGLSELSAQRYEREKNELDAWYEKEKLAIENSLLTETEKTAKLEALDKEFAEKKKKLEIAQAEANKKSSLMQAIVNTALAVTSALSMKPFFPMGLIAAAAALAAGYIQIRVIQAQAIPMAAGGLVREPTNILAGEAGPEAILPMRELKRMLGVDRKSGVGSKTVNVNIHAIDTTGMKRFVNSALIPEIKKALARESLTVAPHAVR